MLVHSTPTTPASSGNNFLAIIFCINGHTFALFRVRLVQAAEASPASPTAVQPLLHQGSTAPALTPYAPWSPSIRCVDNITFCNSNFSCDSIFRNHHAICLNSTAFCTFLCTLSCGSIVSSCVILHLSARALRRPSR